MSSLELSLQRLLAEANPRKERELVEAAQGALERLQALRLAQANAVPSTSAASTPATSIDDGRSSASHTPEPGTTTSSTSPAGTPTPPKSNTAPSLQSSASSITLQNRGSLSMGGADAFEAEEYWHVFKIACGTTVSSKVKVLALDALHKLLAHGKLTGDAPLVLPSTPAKPAGKGPKFAHFSEVNDLSHIDCSDPSDHLVPNVPGANTVGPYNYPSPPRLMDEIVHTICMTYRGPATDDNVSLQVIKILLTLVTSSTCEVHHASLLKIIQTCSNIYCWAKSPILQATAKAGLTQMVNQTISTMEHDHHVLKDIEHTLGQNGVAVASDGLASSSSSDEEERQKHNGSPTPTATVVQDTSSASAEDASAHEPAEEQTLAQTSEQELQTTEQEEEAEKGSQTTEQLHESDQDQSTVDQELKEPEQTQRPTSPTVDGKTSGQDDAQVQKAPVPDVTVTEAAPAVAPQRELTPMEKAIIACRVSRQDTYLTFRLLCKLSMRTELPLQEELSIRGRALVLELLLSMMNNSGPIFQSDDLYVSAARQYLCVSLSQNGASANETLFEFSLSLFLMVLRFYRAQLKGEVEVLFNEFYLKFLDMPNATTRQKEMVLQGLHKICSNPQSLVDIYLNFDCDFSMASVFEHIVNSLSRIAQGRGKVNAAMTVGNMMGKQLLLNEKDAWALIQDRRLALQGLRCMVSVLDSLVEWSKDIGPSMGVQEAVAAATAAALGASTTALATNGHKKEASMDQSPAVTATGAANGSLDAATTMASATANVTQDSESGSPLSPRSTHASSQYSKVIQPVIVSKNPLLAMSMRTHRSMSPSLSSISVNTAGSSESMGDDHPAEFEEIMTRKQLFLKGIQLFNSKPNKGVDFMIKQGFVVDDVPAIATLLMMTPGLSKKSIGEYIGEGEEKAIRVMHAFVDLLDFSGKGFVDALRMFLQTFRLPGEAQKIDRLMEKFADRYCEGNPKVFANADTAYTLAFSVIMLNTDQHSTQVKKRMDVNDFIKNNRGINNNDDLPDDYLADIFRDISITEIVLEEEQAKEATKTGVNTTANTKQRQELHDIAITQMQKNARALLAGNDGRSRSAAAWRNATHAEHVKPMFAVACWPAMATLSLAFEEAVDPALFTNKGEPKVREFTAINAEAITLSLQGLMSAIRIASIFHMEVERDAFISSLAKLTGMNHVSEMQPKNVQAIRTLLKVANTMGEHLEGNWNLVLKTISAMEQLQLIPQGGRVSTEGFNGVDYQHSGSGASGPNGGNIPPQAQQTSRRKASFSAMMNEFQSQDTIIAIDKIFVNSTSLSGGAIVHLFKSICAVSLEEVEARNAPRMYMLQRIVEIADYNMVRIRFEWTQIWKILQSYFNAVGCHSNATVSTFAIDSLRQLAMKFLARDELAHFNTQNELLRPFEHIYKNNPSMAIHELIIASLDQMILARASNIRSGWKPMFGVFGRTATESNGFLVEKSLNIVQRIYDDKAKKTGFDVIEASFVDYISCLVEFCFNYDEDIVNRAMTLLKQCARDLLLEARENSAAAQQSTSSPTESSAATTDVMAKRLSMSAPGATSEEEEDIFFLKWFPIVYGLSRVVIDSDLPKMRSRALDTLFDILHGSGEIFESQYWSKIYRVVLMPIFEDLKDPDYKRRDLTTTIWIHALRHMINLYSRQYHQVFYAQTDFLRGLLELITLLVSKKSENLGQMGIKCLHQLVIRNGIKFDEERWELVTETLERIFDITTPHEVMVLDTRLPSQDGSVAPSPVDPVTGLAPAIPPVPKFDFQETVTKCAIHLVAITFVKDMTLVDLSLWPSSSAPYTGHHVAAPPPAPSTFNPQQQDGNGVQSGGRENLSRSSSFSGASTAEGAASANNNNNNNSHLHQVPAPKPRFLHSMPTNLRHRWLECLRKSYRFVRAFNDNFELRHYLFKSGQIQQMPNMFKQENLALTTYVSVLFDFYRQFGDGEGYDAEDEIQAVLEPLVQESKLIVARYLGMLSEPNKYPKDVIVNQSQLTIMVLRELQRTPIWWPNAAVVPSLSSTSSPSANGAESPGGRIMTTTISLSRTSSPSTASQQQQEGGGSSSRAKAVAAQMEADRRKYQGLRRELPDYFRLAIRLIGVERTDVRVALQEFMGRVGELLVLE
ncbi:Brefeldin A-inhibited guanine nucleotide-exchange protein 2 [Actinomortierella ambigua]|nr:Brefeldin A-inhibited guanine nucleotide-exchange protein 2 [Actinomortierella ambigua]